MKPIRLEFQGINSFSEHTIIDFNALTKNGIFGIFGDTGSGKSTILDCINFALYGNVERSKEKTDIINYRCNVAEVKFIFNIQSEGKRRTYTVERSIKRDKNGTHKAMLYEDDLCIADKASAVEKKVIEILGVEDEDFRKCIALPQGEFAQFVQSAPRERLALIERLFSLSRYGDRLREKLVARMNEIESEYQNYSGKLSGYDDVTEQAAQNKEIQLKTEEKKLKALTERAKKAAKECERLNALNEKRKELENVINETEKLNADREKIEELKKKLTALPACREAVQTYDKAEKLKSDVGKLDWDIRALTEKAENENSKIKTLDKRLKDGDFDEKIVSCLALKAKYDVCEGKPEKLKKILEELDGKRAEYREKEAELEKLASKREQAEAEVKKCEAALAENSGKNLEQFINVQFKGAVLKTEYVKNLDYFARLGGDINVYKDDTPLYEFVSGEVSKKIEEYKNRILDVKDFSVEKIDEQLKLLQKNEENRELLRKQADVKKQALLEVSSAIELKQSEIKNVQKDGAELRARADELKEELEKVFGADCADYSAAAERNDEEIRQLKAQKQELSNSLEAAKKNKNDFELNIEKLKTLRQTRCSEIAENEIKLANILVNGGFDGIESCRRVTEEFAEYPDAEEAVSRYEKRLSVLTEKRAELEKVKDICGATDEKCFAAKSESDALDAEIKAYTASVAVLKADAENLRRRLEEKQAILKDFERLQHDRDVAARLKEATKNNKFLEFIANEYLFDISSVASSTLLNLTDGRYFLTYKDNNFFIGDNFNCGNLRGVNTLSGGETFLVSLSLALSLSRTICAKSLKSIEFFFLDEGFGTLDSSLVDTVMGALEKLKSSSFTIGVISHVEELKYRIDSKIIVNKATESHGSTVNMCC